MPREPQSPRRPPRVRLAARPVEQIADGVWLLCGGVQRIMNVYFVRDTGRDGVLVFDGGIRSMTGAVAAAGARLGGITRVVLGHGHADHRGVPAALGVPVLCHPAERSSVEGDGGFSELRFERLPVPYRYVMPRALRRWDGGPVEVAATLEEGDEIAGFRVIDLPGHTRGQIGLWRERDGVALTTDCFYAVDGRTGRKGDGRPRMPQAAYTADEAGARRSLRKLAALAPAIVGPGHGDPVHGNVAAQLERAARDT